MMLIIVFFVETQYGLCEVFYSVTF